ncbi:MAG: tetratricopeptide repeat protein [Pseudomonadota bacterium]
MSHRVLFAVLFAATSLSGCAAQDAIGSSEPAIAELDPSSAAERFGGAVLSKNALATAVRAPNGTPLGLDGYETPRDALEAGDMAAFIAFTSEAFEDGEAPDGIGPFILAVDRIADGDLDAARLFLSSEDASAYGELLGDFATAWLLAIEGDVSGAISAQRRASAALPGLTGDLSLASMLEAAGREEEALAVYASLTPARIEAPEHEFDPQGLIFTHVQMVVSRRTLLLQRMGRIEEAKDVYRTLAAAEPERAVQYDAAINSLETGRGLDTEPLTMMGGFARSISDLSLAFYQQDLIRNAMVGRRLRGLNEQRATFDQLALLVDPTSETLREIVVGTLANEALYKGAAHTALTAPEPEASLQIAAAQSLLMDDQPDPARDAIAKAIDIADEDDQLSVYSGAIGLHALMGDEERALSLADTAITLVTNPAEEAGFNGMKASILQQFGRYEDAVVFASRARDLDNTHDRRMALANVMGEAGMIDRAIRLLQIERLKRPDDPYMLNTYGYFLLQHTEGYDEAFKVLYLANALASNNPYIADSLGWAYFKLGHLEDAKRLIELARDELAPQKHWEIEDHLGDILWYMDDQEGARRAWETSLAEFPPEEVRKTILEKLDAGLSVPAPEKQPLPRVDAEPADLESRET